MFPARIRATAGGGWAPAAPPAALAAASFHGSNAATVDPIAAPSPALAGSSAARPVAMPGEGHADGVYFATPGSRHVSPLRTAPSALNHSGALDQSSVVYTPHAGPVPVTGGMQHYSAASVGGATAPGVTPARPVDRSLGAPAAGAAPAFPNGDSAAVRSIEAEVRARTDLLHRAVEGLEAMLKGAMAVDAQWTDHAVDQDVGEGPQSPAAIARRASLRQWDDDEASRADERDESRSRAASVAADDDGENEESFYLAEGPPRPSYRHSSFGGDAKATAGTPGRPSSAARRGPSVAGTAFADGSYVDDRGDLRADDGSLLSRRSSEAPSRATRGSLAFFDDGSFIDANGDLCGSDGAVVSRRTSRSAPPSRPASRASVAFEDGSFIDDGGDLRSAAGAVVSRRSSKAPRSRAASNAAALFDDGTFVDGRTGSLCAPSGDVLSRRASKSAAPRPSRASAVAGTAFDDGSYVDGNGNLRAGSNGALVAPASTRPSRIAQARGPLALFGDGSFVDGNGDLCGGNGAVLAQCVRPPSRAGNRASLQGRSPSRVGSHGAVSPSARGPGRRAESPMVKSSQSPGRSPNPSPGRQSMDGQRTGPTGNRYSAFGLPPPADGQPDDLVEFGPAGQGRSLARTEGQGQGQGQGSQGRRRDSDYEFPYDAESTGSDDRHHSVRSAGVGPQSEFDDREHRLSMHSAAAGPDDDDDEYRGRRSTDRRSLPQYSEGDPYGSHASLRQSAIDRRRSMASAAGTDAGEDRMAASVGDVTVGGEEWERHVTEKERRRVAEEKKARAAAAERWAQFQAQAQQRRQALEDLELEKRRELLQDEHDLHYRRMKDFAVILHRLVAVEERHDAQRMRALMAQLAKHKEEHLRGEIHRQATIEEVEASLYRDVANGIAHRGFDGSAAQGLESASAEYPASQRGASPSTSPFVRAVQRERAADQVEADRAAVRSFTLSPGDAPLFGTERKAPPPAAALAASSLETQHTPQPPQRRASAMESRMASRRGSAHAPAADGEPGRPWQDLSQQRRSSAEVAATSHLAAGPSLMSNLSQLSNAPGSVANGSTLARSSAGSARVRRVSLPTADVTRVLGGATPQDDKRRRKAELMKVLARPSS